jgi:pimeloyl-ACP methyl ester carboxylesterase
VRKLALVIAVGVALVPLAVILFLGVSGSTPPITDADGRPLPYSIAALEPVEIGGMRQWILIRGADRDNPVLLWLHGRPGGAQMPFAYHLDGALERHFVVVHWDQRGAGKSNHGGFDEATMRLERYLDDARELLEHLRRRLGVERVVLLGHSWGSRLGIELVARHPEYVQACIGVSQVVDHERATLIAGDWLEGVIDPGTDPEDLRELRSIEMPARRHSEYRRLNQLTDRYGGSLDIPVRELASIAVRAPEYGTLDYFRLLQGMNRGGRPMHEGGIMESYNYIRAVPAVDVPVYFLSGDGDYNTPLALVAEYHERLQAPVKKLIVFERAAHLPFFADPDRCAEFVFGMNLSLDGYIDHQAFTPDPALFRHWIDRVRALTGSVYGRRMYEVMRYWDEDHPVGPRTNATSRRRGGVSRSGWSHGR